MRLFTVSTLLLLLLVSEQTQGTRLGNQLGGVKLVNEEETTLVTKTSSNGVTKEEIMVDGHCSGNNRKLISVTPTTTTTAITSKNNNKPQQLVGHNHDQEETSNSHVNSLTTSDQRHSKTDKYLDETDLVEMDYSPARRKTPIHN